MISLPATGGRLKIAAHQMQVIARQQNDLAGADHEVLAILTLDAGYEIHPR